MKYRQLLICLVVLMTFTCCKPSKKKAYEMRVTQEIATIDQHYRFSNVPGLINDYAIYPEHRSRTYGYLFNDIDYSMYSYETLVRFSTSTTDPKLKAGFENVIIKREREMIGKHYNSSDVSKLINDYSSYKNSSNYVRDLLSVKMDYSTFSYDDLVRFKSESANTGLKDVFLGIVDERENEIIEDLSNRSIKYLGNYYNENESQRYFIDEYIVRTYVNTIDNIAYKDVKQLEFFLAESPYYNIFSKKRSDMKTKLNGQIKKDQEKIAAAENKTVDYFEYSLKAALTDYFDKQLGKIFAACIDNPQLAKMSRKETKEFVAETVNKYISNEQINNICNKQVRIYSDNINNSRMEIIRNITSPMVDSVNVKNVMGASAKHEFDYNGKAGGELGNKQNGKHYAEIILGVGGTVCLFVPGLQVVGAIMFAAATGLYAADSIITSYNPNRNEDKFIEEMKKNAAEYTDEIVGVSVENFRNSIGQSQKEFLNAYYELY